MPIHDWTRVSDGTFHDFHCAWIVEIRNALNKGLLPADYYAQAEQVAGEIGPDVLTLHVNGHSGPSSPEVPPGATATAVQPPRVRFTATAEIDEYAKKRRSLIIRHSSGDRIVAVVEVVSPGNKSSRHALRAFLGKAAGALVHGCHLLLVDLFPPSPRDLQGIHGVIWDEIAGGAYEAPADKPLTLAAYSAGSPVTAYVEPVAVGDVLPDMPLFLEPSSYVSIPLERTYQAAWEGVPRRWRIVLEAPAS